MQVQGYQQFKKLSKDQQYDMVIQKKQDSPTPLPQIAKFPQIDFMKLTSTQDKKPIKLATYRYPTSNTKGVVIIFHTMGYHVGVYGNIAKGLSQFGFTVVGYDQRGHGKSEGEKGLFDDHKLVTKDAHTFISNIFKEYPNLPIFLLGHGLGGLLSIVFSQQFKEFKFSGLILTGPSLKKPAQSKALSAISDFALKLMPNSVGIFPLMFQNVCRNPNASEYLKKDPLIFHEKVCVGTLTQMMQIMEKNEEKKWGGLQTCPVVIVQGQYDKVADPINSITFFQAIKTKDKEYWWYPKMWNNFFFQEQAGEVIARIGKWMQKRV